MTLPLKPGSFADYDALTTPGQRVKGGISTHLGVGYSRIIQHLLLHSANSRKAPQKKRKNPRREISPAIWRRQRHAESRKIFESSRQKCPQSYLLHFERRKESVRERVRRAGCFMPGIFPHKATAVKGSRLHQSNFTRKLSRIVLLNYTTYPCALHSEARLR